MTEAVIVSAARTPIGRARKGTLADVDAFALARSRYGRAGALGHSRRGHRRHVLAESLQGGGVIARNVAVRLGLIQVPGLADNRHCAAGLAAIRSRRRASGPAWTGSWWPAAPRASVRPPDPEVDPGAGRRFPAVDVPEPSGDA